MKAMVLERIYKIDTHRQFLTLKDLPKPLPAANEALLELKTGKIRGAKVLKIS